MKYAVAVVIKDLEGQMGNQLKLMIMDSRSEDEALGTMMRSIAEINPKKVILYHLVSAVPES